LWPPDRTELHFLLGALHGLMAAASNGLGFRSAAEELIRTGWAYASTIDHRPLMAWLRLEQSNIVFWDRPHQSRDLAKSGLQYVDDGPIAAQLHLRYSRAVARVGDTAAARQAITAAHQARENDHRDDLTAIGGEFGLSRATQHYYAGATLVEIPDTAVQRDAVTELEAAKRLYEAGPEAGEHHYWGYAACSLVDLATAYVRTGELEGATHILATVLALPPAKRIEALHRRLERLRPELVSARYRGTNLASELDQGIESFYAETIVNDLRELPAGPG
jgi:hypothetical protein